MLMAGGGEGGGGRPGVRVRHRLAGQSQRCLPVCGRTILVFVATLDAHKHKHEFKRHNVFSQRVTPGNGIENLHT